MDALRSVGGSFSFQLGGLIMKRRLSAAMVCFALALPLLPMAALAAAAGTPEKPGKSQKHWKHQGNAEKTPVTRTLRVFFMLVDQAGIEPASESRLTGTSPGSVGHLHSLTCARIDTLTRLVAS